MYLYLDRANGWPTDLPQLSCKGRAADLERQTPANIERRLIDVEVVAPVGLAGVVAAPFGDDARVSLPPVSRGSMLA